MLAVAYGHIDAVSLLLEKEANVDAVDTVGCTALHRGVCMPLSASVYIEGYVRLSPPQSSSFPASLLYFP